MATISEALAMAMEHHQAGRLYCVWGVAVRRRGMTGWLSGGLSSCRLRGVLFVFDAACGVSALRRDGDERQLFRDLEEHMNQFGKLTIRGQFD